MLLRRRPPSRAINSFHGGATPSSPSLLSYISVQQPSPPDSIVLIKHCCKPVSVLLKQFSKAQGHSSNIPLLCLFSTSRARAVAAVAAGENSGPPHLWPFDWLLYLDPESTGARLTDRCGHSGWLRLVCGEILPNKADFFQLFFVLQWFELASVNTEERRSKRSRARLTSLRIPRCE